MKDTPNPSYNYANPFHQDNFFRRNTEPLQSCLSVSSSRNAAIIFLNASGNLGFVERNG